MEKVKIGDTILFKCFPTAEANEGEVIATAKGYIKMKYFSAVSSLRKIEWFDLKNIIILGTVTY